MVASPEPEPIQKMPRAPNADKPNFHQGEHTLQGYAHDRVEWMGHRPQCGSVLPAVADDTVMQLVNHCQGDEQATQDDRPARRGKVGADLQHSLPMSGPRLLHPWILTSLLSGGCLRQGCINRMLIQVQLAAHPCKSRAQESSHRTSKGHSF